MLSRSIIASLTRSFLEAAVLATAFGFLFESRLWKLLRRCLCVQKFDLLKQKPSSYRRGFVHPGSLDDRLYPLRFHLSLRHPDAVCQRLQAVVTLCPLLDQTCVAKPQYVDHFAAFLRGGRQSAGNSSSIRRSSINSASRRSFLCRDTARFPYQ